MQRTLSLGPVLRRTFRKPQFWFGLAWIVPTIAYYCLFLVGPMVRAFPMSLLEYNLVDPAKSIFVGLGNFRTLFAKPYFLTAVKNTLGWAALSFGLNIPLATLLSVLLTRLRRGRNLYQGIAFLPVVVSMVAVSLLFQMLLNPDVGPVNAALESLHLPTSKFLTDSSSALVTCAFIATWKGVGFNIVILTAGILAIPEELYDAARVDGVNEWQRFWKITFPLMANTLLLISVMTAIGAFQEFTGVFVLTGGGPGNATLMYNLLIYNEAFKSARFGTATAMALMQFVVILAISYLQIRLLRPKWSY